MRVYSENHLQTRHSNYGLCLDSWFVPLQDRNPVPVVQTSLPENRKSALPHLADRSYRAHPYLT